MKNVPAIFGAWKNIVNMRAGKLQTKLKLVEKNLGMSTLE